MKWGLLKQMNRWTEKDHLVIPEMIQIYCGTPVEKLLLFKEDLWNIFDFSKTKAKAIVKRNALTQEHRWQDSWHLPKCMNFLINVWRQMGTVRRGFKTHQGRLNQRKLFQVTHYLKLPL